MKKFVLTNKIPLITGFIFLLMFVVSGLFSTSFEAIRSERLEKALFLPAYPGGEKIIERDLEGLMSQPDGTKIIRSFDVLIGSEKVGMIYIAEATGRNEGLQVAFGIETATKKLIGYTIVQSNETPQYFDLIKDPFYAQLSGKNLDDVTFGLNLVSGATVSSAAIERMLKLTRLQFGADIGWEVPSIQVVLVSKTQDFSDLSTTKLLYTFSYNEEGVEKTNVVTLTRNLQTANPYYSYVSSTEEASDVLKTLFVLEASKSANRVKAVVLSVDGLTLTVRGTGYDGPITATVIMNVSGSVADFTITSEGESYPDFTGLDPIAELPGQYVIDQEDLDNAQISSGATVTSNSIKEMFRIALAYGREVGFNG